MCAFVRHLGVVSQSPSVPFNVVAQIVAALQKQLTRDFMPIWDIAATVDPFSRLDQIPSGYWAIVIRDGIGNDAVAGFHTDSAGQPYALVDARRPGLSVAVSHEALEMLVDPGGNQLISSDSIVIGQGRVSYLVEVCDPCESMDYAYTVNGIAVSDFLTPHYFDPTTSGGVRYSYSGAIAAPKQVLPGGYLTWMDPIETRWYQAQYFNGEFAVAGPFDWRRGSSGSWRSVVDAQTRQPSVLRGPVASTRITASARSRTLRSASVVLAAKANAARLSADIESLSLRIAQNEAGTLVARRRKRKS